MNEKRLKQAKIDYERLSAVIGQDLALYCVCAVYDIAYNAESDAEDFSEYVKKHGDLVFETGNTDVQTALLSGMDETERWHTIWGDGYSESDYKQLDDLYQTMTSQLDATGGIDRQQEDTARTCAMMALEHRKLIRKADKDSVAMAKQYDQMIRENLKDSNMRKADILPSAQQKLPAIVNVLKDRLGLKMEMTQDDVWQSFHKWCNKKKYPFTLDAAEQIVMLILNLIQKNDDLPELSEAPSEMDFESHAAEFEKDISDEENESYDYLGLERGIWHRSARKEGDA